MNKGLTIIAVVLTAVGTGRCVAWAQRVNLAAAENAGPVVDEAAPAPWPDGAPQGDEAFCNDGSCETGVAGNCVAGACTPCCAPRWAHRSGLFGEFLYLRARDAEVAYAAPVDGPVTAPGNPADPGNQIGAVALVDPDYQPAYRIGFERAWDDCSGIRASFTRFESNTTNAISGAAQDRYVQSMVTHPGVQDAGDNWLEGAAGLDIDFKLIDVDYRWLYAHSDLYAVNLLAGARYGQLTQDFQALFSVNGSRSVDTHLKFDGGGIRVGIEAERFAPCTGWMAYGRGVASFVAGDFRADYFQGSSFASTEIDTRWKSGRVVTMLDLELGLGWTGPRDRLRFRAGYLFSAWLNTLQMDEWIDAVNANHFTDLGGETMSFDGFTVQAEYRF